ncbi:hypothetical protein JKG47_17015 [Acidithiobacillus sp. MC6.1]|nr:hypothetical protein [Acidithiobacillus sp. MC6.1]
MVIETNEITKAFHCCFSVVFSQGPPAPVPGIKNLAVFNATPATKPMPRTYGRSATRAEFAVVSGLADVDQDLRNAGGRFQGHLVLAPDDRHQGCPGQVRVAVQHLRGLVSRNSLHHGGIVALLEGLLVAFRGMSAPRSRKKKSPCWRHIRN